MLRDTSSVVMVSENGIAEIPMQQRGISLSRLAEPSIGSTIARNSGFPSAFITPRSSVMISNCIPDSCSTLTMISSARWSSSRVLSPKGLSVPVCSAAKSRLSRTLFFAISTALIRTCMSVIVSSRGFEGMTIYNTIRP